MKEIRFCCMHIFKQYISKIKSCTWFSIMAHGRSSLSAENKHIFPNFIFCSINREKKHASQFSILASKILTDYGISGNRHRQPTLGNKLLRCLVPSWCQKQGCVSNAEQSQFSGCRSFLPYMLCVSVSLPHMWYELLHRALFPCREGHWLSEQRPRWSFCRTVAHYSLSATAAFGLETFLSWQQCNICKNCV